MRKLNTNDMELVFRTRTTMVIKIKGRVYTFYRTPHGIDIISDNGQRFYEEWML